MAVCGDQKTFEKALKRASHYVKREERPRRIVVLLYTAIYLALAVWALMLAVKTAPPGDQIKHLVLALLFPPVYIVACYLGN